MTTSPYNLQLNTENPTQFYDDLKPFTNEVIIKGKTMLQNYLSEYELFSKQKVKQQYTQNEYLIELLMVGTFWNNYKTKLSIDAVFYRPLFSQLYSFRSTFKALKSKTDNYRGKLAYSLLSKDRNKSIEIYERFEYLLSWLDCTKEYKQEVERLENWKLFIENQNVDYQKDFWNNIIDFAKWFETEANLQLGLYTANWSEFMMDSAAEYKNKENYFFCTRKPNEYHLNMVAAQVMNDALKPEYQNTSNKILLVPKCMVKSSNCKAVLKNGNYECTNCSADCSVANIKNTLNKKAVKTVIIPHSSSFSKYLKPWQNSSDTALIGVACTLNLITGGYEMQKLNIPSQCVFLDSCGCKKHWKSGEPTKVNTAQLNKVLFSNESIKKPVNSTC